ncbi:glycosyl hydrolase 2 galactose-binding domain-containing protein [Actinomycetes bacterium M1A6_2h]
MSGTPLRWRCVFTDPGVCAGPSDLDAMDRDWLPACVPGTAAQALAARLSAAELQRFDFDAVDWWFVGSADTDSASGVPHPVTVQFDGVATVSDVWIDDRHVAHSESMFLPFSVETEQVRTIVIKCAAMTDVLKRRRPRGRWRSSMVAQQGLRWFRTTVFGRADLFGGAPAPVGPWRDVRVIRCPAPELKSHMDGDTGVLSVRVHTPSGALVAPVSIDVGDRSFDVVPTSDSAVEAVIEIPDVERWWPHTHGQPRLHHVVVRSGTEVIDCGAVGFREVKVSRADGGFALSVNGIPVFCRGACWVPIDPVTLNASPERTRRALEQVAEAGLNMIRVTGTMVYEDTHFWDMCAELGIMVWQDVMLATFDPPATVEFEAVLDSEVRSVLAPLSANPALTVVSGGSETEQQPAMLGLNASDYSMPALDTVVPDAVSAVAPTVVHVSSSPSGPHGTAPFEVGSGVAHYFGVGGYLQPLASVRTAGVRFAAECLAFAIPPDRATVDAAFGSASAAGHHPAWKSAVPRDRGSSWDFEDVRDHYVREVFGVDPFAVRRSNPEKYLDFGRAAVCSAVAASFSHWRRRDSSCGGALVLTMRDFEDGAGWGLIDSRGVPKAPWHTLRRLCAARSVVLSDLGLDGLRVDVYNDHDSPLRAVLLLHQHDMSGQISGTKEVDLDVPAHGSWSEKSAVLWPEFTDVSYAFKFGPPASVGVTAELIGKAGRVVAVDVLPVVVGPMAMQQTVGLSAVATLGEGGWSVAVSALSPALFVSIEVPGFEPSDSWFHLLPGSVRSIDMRPLPGTDGDTARLRGRVRALNALRESPFHGSASQQ